MADDKRPLRAFSGGAHNRVLRGISRLADHCRKLRRVVWTADELRALFLPQYMHYSLTQAYELQEGGYLGSQILFATLPQIEAVLPNVTATWENPRMMFTFDWANTKDGFLVPLRHGSMDSPARLNEAARDRPRSQDVPPELLEKWNGVVRHEMRIAYEWGLVQHAYNSLNQSTACTTPAQLRYIWPALVPILKSAGEDDMASRLTQASSRAGDSARCPAALLPHLKTTYDIVAKGVLLSEVADPPEPPDAIGYKPYDPQFSDPLGNKFKGYS